MTEDFKQALVKMLVRHEALRLHPYLCPSGYINKLLNIFKKYVTIPLWKDKEDCVLIRVKLDLKPRNFALIAESQKLYLCFIKEQGNLTWQGHIVRSVNNL